MGEQIKVRRYETLTTCVEGWVTLPDGITPDKLSSYDKFELDDLITDLAMSVDLDEEVVDVIDTDTWEVIS